MPAYTSEDDALLIELRPTTPAKIIAERLTALGRQRSPASVVQRITKLEKEGRLAPLSKDIRSQRIQIARTKREDAWTTNLDQRLIELRLQRTPVERIATLLERSASTVEKHIQILKETGRLPPDDLRDEIADLTGQPFGHLTAIERGPDVRRRGGSQTPAWYCTCDCGTETAPRIVLIQHYNLLYHYTKSCGCLRANYVPKSKAEIAEQRKALKRCRKANGVCWSCNGQNGPVLDGLLQCRVCRDRANATQERRKSLHEVEGLCVHCRSPRIAGTYCRKHWLAFRACVALGDASLWRQLDQQWVEQEGRCAYTGDVLIEGPDASNDHRVSLSRGGLKTIENVQWTTRLVNKNKASATCDEFVGMCALITEAL